VAIAVIVPRKRNCCQTSIHKPEEQGLVSPWFVAVTLLDRRLCNLLNGFPVPFAFIPSHLSRAPRCEQINAAFGRRVCRSPD
jgi:hypothetical protein